MTVFEDFLSYNVLVRYKNEYYYGKEKESEERREGGKPKLCCEILRFQAHWGLKQLGNEDGNLFHKLVDAEVNFIAELDLAQDMLAIKSLIDGVKQSFKATPTLEKGDFVKSPTAVALGIASVEDINNIGIPLTWNEMIAQKILTIYYPEEYRNQIIDWAKANGYCSSTYLGRPMVKFSKLYIIIDRTRT